MKKLVTFLLVLPIFASCSTDSVSAPEVAATPANLKVAQQVDINNKSFQLDYNANHTLHSAVSAQDSYVLTYAGATIVNVSGTANDESFDVDFTYDAQNHIDGMTVNGVAKYVTYDAAKNEYELKDSPQSVSKRLFRLTADGDLRETVFFGNNGNQMNGKVYLYDASQKGPLFNANRVTLQLAMASPKNAMYSCAFGGYRPFTKMATAHDGMVDFQNSYDGDGFVSASIQDEDNFAHFTYGNN